MLHDNPPSSYSSPSTISTLHSLLRRNHYISVVTLLSDGAIIHHCFFHNLLHRESFNFVYYFFLRQVQLLTITLLFFLIENNRIVHTEIGGEELGAILNPSTSYTSWGRAEVRCAQGNSLCVIVVMLFGYDE
mmetsp:Transcript_23311/g.37458  ORF Transcript_23311/g.37458 Transcript_23311/m.37458 type:complete len:132 (+) Transcript_23311:194-589(+)